MYPWVTHTHAHLGGECPHKCSYCYLDNPRFGRPAKYTGELRQIEAEFSVKFGEGKVIFVENCGDLFAEQVPSDVIRRVLAHCQQWHGNTYVFQTKNPIRYMDFLEDFPEDMILGTTIETNRELDGISKAPSQESRKNAMFILPLKFQRFITVEPILAFDLAILASWLIEVAPNFVNIGADSKNHGLPEPTKSEALALVATLKEADIEVREKHNLDRLIA
jgi:DNA repair photolyase